MNALTISIIGLAISVAGLVWRAAQLARDTRNNTEALRELSDELKTTEKRLGSAERLLAVLEERTPPGGTSTRRLRRPRDDDG